jgi:hypothetical protein
MRIETSKRFSYEKPTVALPQKLEPLFEVEPNHSARYYFVRWKSCVHGGLRARPHCPLCLPYWKKLLEISGHDTKHLALD